MVIQFRGSRLETCKRIFVNHYESEDKLFSESQDEKFWGHLFLMLKNLRRTHLGYRVGE